MVPSTQAETSETMGNSVGLAADMDTYFFNDCGESYLGIFHKMPNTQQIDGRVREDTNKLKRITFNNLVTKTPKHRPNHTVPI
ncbi:hypothetical protein ACFXTO_010816 [Malus domestica]